MRGRNPIIGASATFVVTLTASTFLMGSSFVAGKVLLHGGFTPFNLIGWRFLVAALATLPLVVLDGGVKELVPQSVGLRESALMVAVGLLQTGGVMGLTFFAMVTIPASTAAILLFTNPIWVAILGRMFLGESLSLSRTCGLALGILGVCIAICAPGLLSGRGLMRGELLGLASSLCWAFSTLITKRARLPFRPWAVNFWQMLVGSLALLSVSYLQGEHWPHHATVAQWGWFLWLAIPASTGSFGLWFMALHKGGATKASSFLFLTPLFTVVISFFVFDAPLSANQAMGGCLIGVALWLVNRTSRRRHAGDETRSLSPSSKVT